MTGRRERKGWVATSACSKARSRPPTCGSLLQPLGSGLPLGGVGHSAPSCISSSGIQRLGWLPRQALNQPWIMHEIQPQAAHSLLKHRQFIQKECSPSVLPQPRQNTKGKALANSQAGGCGRAGACPARPSSALPPLGSAAAGCQQSESVIRRQ